jgi:putative membrane protein
MSGQETGAIVAAPDATQLALERTYLAHERTMMAWVRTATSMISFGFTIYKFFQYMRESEGLRPIHRLFGSREYAIVMIGSGLISLLLATLQHRRNLKRLKANWPEMPFSIAFVLAALISGLGVLSLLAAFLRQ